MTVTVEKVRVSRGPYVAETVYRLRANGYTFECNAAGRILCVTQPPMKLNKATGQWEPL